MKADPVTVLVVDDEEPIRQELRAFPWESCGMTLIGEAENGAEALALCEARPPDIVVSDITMPIMDGLSFIRELRARRPFVQAILLTCHSDFQFAKEAIRLGALDYILKVSLDEEELKAVLLKAADVLVRERGRLREELKLRRADTLRKLDAFLKQHDAPGHARGDAPGAPGGEAAVPSGPLIGEAFGFRGEPPYRFARLWLSVPYGTHVIAHSAVHSALLDFELDERRCAAVFPISNDEYLIWFSEADDDGPLLAMLDRLLTVIRKKAAETAAADDGETALHAIISSAIRDQDELLRAVRETSDWCDHAFYLPEGASSVRSGMPEPLQPFRDSHAKSLRTRLSRFGWDSEKLAGFVEGDFAQWCGKERIRPGPLKHFLARWAAEWAAELGAAEPWNAEAVSALMAAPNLSGLTGAFSAFVRAAGAKQVRMRPEVRDALFWIKENIREPLSLPLIAERAGLRPEYFSRLFKEETGESVHQYITRLRMEKAMELLKCSNMKVYEIAEAVGIPNYRYFAYTFRNWAGMAPTDVKRRHRPAE